MSATSGKFIQNGTITFNKFGQNGAVVNDTIRWNGTQWVASTLPPDHYLLAGTQLTTSNVYASVTGLITGALPLGTYRWFFSGLAQSTNTNTGVGVRLGLGTAAASVIYGKWSIEQSGTNGTDKFFDYAQKTAADNITSASAPAANTDLVIEGSGAITITTAGTIAIQFRSENNGTQISLRAGTLFGITRVG